MVLDTFSILTRRCKSVINRFRPTPLCDHDDMFQAIVLKFLAASGYIETESEYYFDVLAKNSIISELRKQGKVRVAERQMDYQTDKTASVLDDQELVVANLFTDGYNNTEIQGMLGISHLELWRLKNSIKENLLYAN